MDSSSGCAMTSNTFLFLPEPSMAESGLERHNNLDKIRTILGLYSIESRKKWSHRSRCNSPEEERNAGLDGKQEEHDSTLHREIAQREITPTAAKIHAISKGIAEKRRKGSGDQEPRKPRRRRGFNSHGGAVEKTFILGSRMFYADSRSAVHWLDR